MFKIANIIKEHNFVYRLFYHECSKRSRHSLIFVAMRILLCARTSSCQTSYKVDKLKIRIISKLHDIGLLNTDELFCFERQNLAACRATFTLSSWKLGKRKKALPNNIKVEVVCQSILPLPEFSAGESEGGSASRVGIDPAVTCECMPICDASWELNS